MNERELFQAILEKHPSLMEEIRVEERKRVIDEFESRILGNCSIMYKDSEGIIVVRQDIFKFIVEQMKEGAK